MKNSPEDENKNAVPVTAGLLAHVDAGKTTLAEALLYTSGKLRRLGRVDHKDAFLDTFALEKQRGITIFSKQALLKYNGLLVTLLDTPGHTDFSAETERTLSVLDYAILIISASDGVTGHTLTLFKLLEYYKIPVFIFINKMDQAGADKAALLCCLKEQLSEGCTDFSAEDAAFFEELATCKDDALEEFLGTGKISVQTIKELIASRTVFPCFFGSAARLEKISEFLNALERYIMIPEYPEEFGAVVYKISRDEKGERLSHLKVTGGTLKVKDSPGTSAHKDNPEKINQIRIYDGAKYRLADEVCAGSICAVTGLSQTAAGDCLGAENRRHTARLVPVLSYKIILPDGCDAAGAFPLLKQLEEEDPQLNIIKKEASGEIHIRVMGQVQLEILKSLIKERFGLDVSFEEGSIIYKETILNTVEGVGHFEPLRHYAEVHLLLEPAKRGSGMSFASDVSEDLLDRNWQRLILTHLKEKRHTGVLTGSELTDMKITLKSGRAHPKHTEGGDFRQAAYRAIRQGLMQAESILLEPYYSFRIEIPPETAGRAMSDITRMNGRFDPVRTLNESAVITGSAPVSAMRGYPFELSAYTHGAGRIFMEVSGYEPCHNADEVIKSAAYSAVHDSRNPSSSVFCSGGSGFTVPWDEVFKHMHLEPVLKKEARKADIPAKKSGPAASKSTGAEDKELEEIFERTYGSGTFHKSRSEYICHGSRPKPARGSLREEKKYSLREPEEKILIVDGYNIIFAWDELKSLAGLNIDAAREKLAEILSNFQAFRAVTLILVFDGYRVRGNPGESFKYHNIDIIYTKEGESADQYIEKAAAKLAEKADVTVATSDNLEQISIFGHGARRMSAKELYGIVGQAAQEIREKYLDKFTKTGSGLFDELSDEAAHKIAQIKKHAKEREAQKKQE